LKVKLPSTQISSMNSRVKYILLIGFFIVQAFALTANVQAIIVGVNLLNEPEKLTPPEQNAILNAMNAANVQNIRASIAPNEKGIEFAQRVYAHGIKIDWLVGMKYGPAQPLPDNPRVVHGAWRTPPLSSADPEAFKTDFEARLSQLEARGIKLVAFEIGNELNNPRFNMDFPAHGEGKLLLINHLGGDPEARQVANGLLQYLRVLAVAKDVRDHSKLNRTTPIITSGFANLDPKYLRKSDIDAVSINATLSFLRVHGLDQLVDGYGVHTYTGSPSNLLNSVMAECAPLGSPNGKPCWLTEWGRGVKSASCPVDDAERAAWVSNMRTYLTPLARQGRLAASFYYTWEGLRHGGREDSFSAFLCGGLTRSGRIGIAPM
jgi:hypothetical protein